MSCMISPTMFDQYVVCELEAEAERYERLWYHLDGPRARHHLARLLSLPYVEVIEYTTGDGNPPNGPAYIDMYREIQAAGRCLDLEVPLENMEYLVRHLRPEGVILRTDVSSPAEADELIEKARRWAGSHARRDG
jgi:hypothetical protein